MVCTVIAILAACVKHGQDQANARHEMVSVCIWGTLHQDIMKRLMWAECRSDQDSYLGGLQQPRVRA